MRKTLGVLSLLSVMLVPDSALAQLSSPVKTIMGVPELTIHDSRKEYTDFMFV